MAQKLKKPNDIKIFTLYLMEKIGYPMDFETISTIVIQDDIVNFFDFAECFGALEDAGHVKAIPNPDNEKSPLYEITSTGKTVSDGLNTVLARSIKERSYRSALRHMDLSRRRAVVETSVDVETGGFLFHGTIKDATGTMLNVAIKAENEAQLKRMQNVFAERPEVVFGGITAVLTGDIDYILDSRDN